MIYFGPETWHGLWHRRQQLMTMFSKKNKVLFVEARWHLRPTLSGFGQGTLKFSDLYRRSLRQVSDNLFIFSYPVWAPISGRSPLRELTRMARRFYFRRALQELRISEPIVWFHRPTMIDLFQEVPQARLRIYHVEDEYSAYSGMTEANRRRVKEHEQKMLPLVDVVIVVSERLYQARCAYNAHTYLVPNGVDYGTYSAALADPVLPAELEDINHPRLGFSGLISDRLNLTMLKELAQQYPEWSLVFLGQDKVAEQRETWRTLLALPNVHYVGLKNISEVPNYVKGFDVGLMPYMQDRESKHISPQKLYDYLAAGLPVASIDVPASREFSSYIHIAERPENFMQAVESALADTNRERYQARRNIASQHSWEARVEEISDLIEAQLMAGANKVRSS